MGPECTGRRWGSRGEPEAYPAASVRAARRFAWHSLLSRERGLCQPLEQLFLKGGENACAPRSRTCKPPDFRARMGPLRRNPERHKMRLLSLKTSPDPTQNSSKTAVCPAAIPLPERDRVPCGPVGRSEEGSGGVCPVGSAVRGAASRRPSRRPRGTRRVIAFVRPLTPGRGRVSQHPPAPGKVASRAAGRRRGGCLGTKVSAVVTTT